MPLQNRMLPDGDIVAQSWRGDFMGNRGGRIHNPETRELTRRKWASKRWIICLTRFKERHRKVMGKGYTELFFLDEVSALASGHRPCFECRRKAANAFAEAWRNSFGKFSGSRADTMDRQLHIERTAAPRKIAEEEFNRLPDGVMIVSRWHFYTRKDGVVLQWTGEGYQKEHAVRFDRAFLMTPPSIIEVLKNGYEPCWHKSADKEIA